VEIERKKEAHSTRFPAPSSAASSVRMAAVVLAEQASHGLPAADLVAR
jgi:hypothetical protein